MKPRSVLLLAVALALVPADFGSAAEPDPVVVVNVAKGYQGLLWAGDGLPGVLPGTGTGSGFVIDPDTALAGAASGLECVSIGNERLLVVTNEHVARGATQLRVTFLWEERTGAPQQYEVPAALVMADQRVDLALLSVEAVDLARAGLDPAHVPRMALWPGEPADLARGRAVQALGSPGGLRRTMTTGIVSVPLQSPPFDYAYIPPIRIVQTDAAINQGNSGGPLVLSESDEVVGVNSLGGGQNLNFAIPARRIGILLRQAACGRGLRHGDLPLRWTSVEGSVRAALDLPGLAGEVVLAVAPWVDASPVRPLDVVLSVRGQLQLEAGGTELRTPVGPGGMPLSEALFDLEPGSDAELIVLRDGERLDLRLPVVALDLRGAGPNDHVSFLGAFLERVDDVRRFETGYRGEGLVCGHVLPGSVAARAGLATGDVVERVHLRAGGRRTSVDVDGPESLAALAGSATAALELAERGGPEVALGVEVYNLDSRGRDVKVLRTGVPR